MPFLTPKDKPASERDVALNLGARELPWGEALGANAEAAWDWNALGRAQDSLQEARAQLDEYGGSNWYENAIRAAEDNISKEAWPESEFYREGIEWDEQMNPARARVMAEHYDERREREKLLARQSAAQKVAGFGVQMGVGFTDPVNFIPFLGQAAKLKMIARFGSVGGRMLASGIEAGAGNLVFNPVIGADLERRGETITLSDYAVDTLLGTGVGMLFGGAAGTWAKHFRGETKDAVLRALQHSTLSVNEGRPVDVGPILRDVVEGGQFNRETALRRLTAGGLDPVQSETFLAHLDGLAAAQGMDPDTWVRRHIADVTVGGTDAEGIRFHAAMYRSPAATLKEFIGRARESVGGKQSFFDLGPVPERVGKATGTSGIVTLTSDAVLHVDKRHPLQADEVWGRVMATLAEPDSILPGNTAKGTLGKPYIVIKIDGNMAHAVIIESANGGRRAYVTTSFEDSRNSVENWAAKQNGEEVRMGAGGDSGTSPIPEGKSHVITSSDSNIAHSGRARKALERLQRTARNAAPLRVVDTFDDLPEHVRAKAVARGMEGVTGVNDGRVVYVVADALESESQAVALWMHEQGVHHGLRGLVGDDARFNSLMDAVFEHFGPEEMDGIRQLYGLDFDNVSHRREAAEEMLARIGEKVADGRELGELERSMWEQIKAWFAAFLREHGVDVEMTDADIAQIVRDAVRWTMDGQPTISRGGPQRFAVDGRSNGAVEFLPDGRASVRIFEGADLAEAGEGLSRILAERFGEHPPRERLNWRTERPEREVPDPYDDAEPEAVFAADVETVRELAGQGRLTENELAELRAAEHGVEQAGRWSEAFKAAARCIVRGGV